jgi:hypothetical protein
MNGQNFLQRPGGLGPMAERVKPLGSLATSVPALYQNTPEMIELNRATQLDNVNRVYSQYQVDRGEHTREPVGPTDMQPGNIVPSQQLTGPAGYNHRDSLVIPDKAADLSKGEYLVKTQNTLNPELRNQLKILTSMPQQNFLNAPDPGMAMMTMSYNTPGTLPLQLPPNAAK